jgi:hypothetical protein
LQRNGCSVRWAIVNRRWNGLLVHGQNRASIFDPAISQYVISEYGGWALVCDSNDPADGRIMAMSGLKQTEVKSNDRNLVSKELELAKSTYQRSLHSTALPEA